ncbi:MAG: hypothetical protein M1827_003821 [Pycnora praestabilis]|nr:MAG: hypothetical protein M1827_003821 [Pycnora praestabilis]
MGKKTFTDDQWQAVKDRCHYLYCVDSRPYSQAKICKKINFDGVHPAVHHLRDQLRKWGFKRSVHHPGYSRDGLDQQRREYGSSSVQRSADDSLHELLETLQSLNSYFQTSVIHQRSEQCLGLDEQRYGDFSHSSARGRQGLSMMFKYDQAQRTSNPSVIPGDSQLSSSTRQFCQQDLEDFRMIAWDPKDSSANQGFPIAQQQFTTTNDQTSPNPSYWVDGQLPFVAHEDKSITSPFSLLNHEAIQESPFRCWDEEEVPLDIGCAQRPANTLEQPKVDFIDPELVQESLWPELSRNGVPSSRTPYLWKNEMLLASLLGLDHGPCR